MSWISKAVGIAVLGVLFATPSMAAQRMGGGHIAIGARAIGPRVVVSPRVFVRSAPAFGFGYGGYGYYGPDWYYPGYGYYPYGVPSNLGEIKIDTHLKDASVYVDGGYVGPVSKFKKFSLKSGNHDIELRDAAGHPVFDQRVQVLVGKSIELRPSS